MDWRSSLSSGYNFADGIGGDRKTPACQTPARFAGFRQETRHVVAAKAVRRTCPVPPHSIGALEAPESASVWWPRSLLRWTEHHRLFCAAARAEAPVRGANRWH